MSRRAVTSTIVVVSAMIVSTMGACTDARVFVGDVIPDAGGPPSFTGVEPDAGDAASYSSPPPDLCPSSVCPAPLLTCPTSKHLCDVNPLTDDQNCGACGNACAGDEYESILGGIFSCLEGTCRLSCSGNRGDCDGLPENGCETDLTRAPNCGACGVTCASPSTCVGGKCVNRCPAPSVQTDECGCVDLTSDDANCGACGVQCNPQPDGFDPAPPNSYYGCVAGTCNQLKCRPSNTYSWADCNGDLQKKPSSTSDGCEVDLGSTDSCGRCNNECDPGQLCGLREDLWPNIQAPECLCQPGEDACPGTTSSGTVRCTDLHSDTMNCGACNWICENTYPHAATVCLQGSCGFTCEHGWADCNDVASDGCETNVNEDPANCGGCGLRCEGGPGQACVGGKCLVEPCDVTSPQ